MEIKLRDVIKRELKSKGESLNEVSRKTKIPLSTIHGWSEGVIPNAKNLHLLKRLADHFSISVTTLLFNSKDEESGAAILFSSQFVDDGKRYRLTIEKLPK